MQEKMLWIFPAPDTMWSTKLYKIVIGSNAEAVSKIDMISWRFVCHFSKFGVHTERNREHSRCVTGLLKIGALPCQQTAWLSQVFFRLADWRVQFHLIFVKLEDCLCQSQNGIAGIWDNWREKSSEQGDKGIRGSDTPPGNHWGEFRGVWSP